VLFTAGKEIMALLLRNSNINTIYGASGNIVLILLFVFYSSFILYYGACFIKVYAEHLGEPFRVINKAYRYKLQELNQ
jgi:membrane protein